MDARTEGGEQTTRAAGANRRETQQTAEATRQTAEEMAETNRRMTEQAAEATAHTAEAVSDIGRTGVETVQQGFKSGLDMASQVTDRSLRAMAQAMGVPTPEGAETTQQVTRNVETILKCGTVLAHGFQDISREWTDRAQGRVQNNLDGMGRLMGCRSPQDALRIQSEMVRDGLADFIEASRRVSELMMTVTSEAMGKIASQQQEAPPRQQAR